MAIGESDSSVVHIDTCGRMSLFGLKRNWRSGVQVSILALILKGVVDFVDFLIEILDAVPHLQEHIFGGVRKI